MLGRIILAVLVVALVLWLLRRALAAGRPGRKEAAKEPGSEGQGDLVTCAHCGVNLPKSEARSAGGRHFCSEEHWRLGPRDR